MVHKAIQDITGVGIADAEATCKDMTHARLLRDANDLQLIIDYLLERKPFGMDSKELHSLSSGIIADGSQNVYSDKTAGTAY